MDFSLSLLALVVFPGLLGLVATGSAMGKLTGNAQVISNLTALGLSAGNIKALAVLELAGAAGLLIGIWLPVLGLAASAAFIAYFAGAVIMHVRHGDAVKELAPAAILGVIAIISTLVQLGR